MNTTTIAIEGISKAVSPKHRAPLEVPAEILTVSPSGEVTLVPFGTVKELGKNAIVIYRECEYRLSRLGRETIMHIAPKMSKGVWNPAPLAKRQWDIPAGTALAEHILSVRRERDRAMDGWTVADAIASEYARSDHSYTVSRCPALKADVAKGIERVGGKELIAACNLFVASTTKGEEKSFLKFAEAFGSLRDARSVIIPTEREVKVAKKPHAKPLNSKTVAKIRRKPHNSKADREQLEADIEVAAQAAFAEEKNAIKLEVSKAKASAKA